MKISEEEILVPSLPESLMIFNSGTILSNFLINYSNGIKLPHIKYGHTTTSAFSCNLTSFDINPALKNVPTNTDKCDLINTRRCNSSL